MKTTTQNWHKHVHGQLTHNNQEPETVYMSLSKRIDGHRLNVTIEK